MAKHIKINSSKSEARKIIPILGGLGISEILILLLTTIIFTLTLLMEIEKLIPMYSFFIINIFTILLTLFLIRSQNDTNLKGWEFIYLSIGYIFKNKRIEIKSKGFKKQTEKEILKVTDDFYLGYFIDGKNINSINKDNIDVELNKFKRILNSINCKFKIIKVNLNFNIENIKNNFEKQISITKNKKIISGIEKNLTSLADKNLSKNRYVIFFSFKSLEEAKEKKKYFDNLFFEETNFAQQALNINEMEILINEITLRNIKAIEIHEKQTSIALKIKKKSIHYSYFYISDISKLVNTGWLSKLFNSNDYLVQILFNENNENEALLEEVQKELKKNKIAMSESNKSQNALDKRTINNLLLNEQKNLRSGLTQSKDVSILIRIEDESEKEIKSKYRELSKILKEDGIKISNLKFNQLNAFNLTNSSELSNLEFKISEELTTELIASSWPFMISDVLDRNGLIVGEEKFNVIDFKSRSNTRINSNMFVLASSGAGKTTTVSTIIDNNIKNGDKIFIIDPENEYRKIADYYNGKVVDFSNETINILQVIPDNNENSIKEHVTFIASFFKNLFNDITDLQLAKLKEYVLFLYSSKKIDENKVKRKYKSIDWPVLSDLKKVYEKKVIKEDKSIMEQMLVLGSYINELVDGSFSKLWNCQTKMNFESEIIIFDISRYVENIKVTSSLMNVISKIVWNEMNKIYEENKNSDEEKWSSLIIDEAHLLMNKNNIDSLEWISQVTKRIRKRNGSIFIISQNVSDFLGDQQVKHISSKIINNCTYSLIGQLKPSDVSDLDDMYEASGGLTEYERNYLINAKKFEFILNIGQDKKLFLKNTRPNFLNKESLGWEE